MIEEYFKKYKNLVINKFFDEEPKQTENTEPPTSITSILELEHNKISNEEVSKLIKEILKLDPSFPSNLIHQPEYIKYNELEFFNSNSGSNYPSLFDKINKTYTELGRFHLMNVILHPITNHDILEKRKNIITYFETNKDIYIETIEKLKKLKTLENDVMWFFKTRSPEMDKVLEIVYFQNWWSSFLNIKDHFLHYYYTFIILISPVYGALMPLVFFIIPYIVIYFIYGSWVPISSYISLIKTLFFSGGGFISMISNMYSMFSNGKTSKILNFLSTSGIIKFIYYLITIGTYIYGIYISVMNSISYYKIISFIHTKLNILASFTKLIKDIHNTIELSINEFLGFKTLDIPNDEIKTFENLWNDEILNSHHITTHKGIILSTFWKIKDKCKNTINTWMKYISSVDTWISNTTLYIENNNNHSNTLPMTMPIYIKNITNTKSKSLSLSSTKPIISIEDFWNLLTIENKEPILNSITLGNNNQQNAIITSPNASGKSTCMKSIIEIIILAQTICVVPAKKCNLTPFTQINTYLNIPDTQGKESLFQAEMKRCSTQITKLKTLKSNEYAFTIMDEIFTSTNHDEGVAGSYAIIRKMARYTNSICMVSTHFKIISSIFRKNKNFISLHLPITISKIPSNDIKNTTTTIEIKKSYKLTEGLPTHPQIAIELLNINGFDSDIISDARKMFKKLNLKQNKKVKTV